MTSRTIYYLLSVLTLFTVIIGTCIYILRNEKTSKKLRRVYQSIIVVDVFAIISFIVNCITFVDQNVHNIVSIWLDITIVVLLLEVIIIIIFEIRDASNRPPIIKRETFDLDEEHFTTEENITVCYTKKKKSTESKGTIVFMHPDYYVTDLNGRVWYEERKKKILLGHTGKYDEISDYFVRQGYQTLRYDHSELKTSISIEQVAHSMGKVLKDKNANNVIVFCSGNINDFMPQIVEGIKPTKLICTGITNRNALDYINGLKEHMPVFIGAFGDDPYCNINNKDAVYFENTDFTYCIRGKKKLKKYGRKVENQGITDLSALAIINEWL